MAPVIGAFTGWWVGWWVDGFHQQFSSGIHGGLKFRLVLDDCLPSTPEASFAK
jgi:hypothetical protein